MKYFLDTEFIEGWKKPISWLPTIGNFNKKYHSIQLISIGIVAEDGREYYAISKDFNLKEAWNRNDIDPNHKRNYKQKDNYWIRENVLKPIFEEMRKEYMKHEYVTYLNSDYKNFNYSNFKALLFKYGKTNKQIAEEIKHFCDASKNIHPSNEFFYGDLKNVDFYAYYADYDWVVFCSLFGTMMDLPKGFPMYCKDLKQMLDEKVFDFCANEIQSTSFKSALKRIKIHKNYPKQENEHNALDDAKWNYKLFSFIKNKNMSEEMAPYGKREKTSYSLKELNDLSTDELFGLIEQWGEDRNFYGEGGATPLGQFAKLISEAGELADNLAKGKDVRDDIGDMAVVMVAIARLKRTNMRECLAQAYFDIKDRKGTWVNGTFVKENKKDPVPYDMSKAEEIIQKFTDEPLKYKLGFEGEKE